MSEPTMAALVETARIAVEDGRTSDALTALDAALAITHNALGIESMRCEKAEGDLERQREATQKWYDEAHEKRTALERAERERDAGNEKHLVLWRRWQDAEARAQKAEAEVASLREAERLHVEAHGRYEKSLEKAEAVVEAARPYVENAAPDEQLFSAVDLHNFMRLERALTAYDEPPAQRGTAIAGFVVDGKHAHPVDEPPTEQPDFWRPKGECPEC
jgi:hypothetical protein